MSTSPNFKATSEGVRDAWDFWLSQHPVTLGDLIEDAIRAAVKDWLHSHTAELIEAIAKTAADEIRSTTMANLSDTTKEN